MDSVSNNDDDADADANTLDNGNDDDAQIAAQHAAEDARIAAERAAEDARRAAQRTKGKAKLVTTPTRMIIPCMSARGPPRAPPTSHVKLEVCNLCSPTMSLECFAEYFGFKGKPGDYKLKFPVALEPHAARTGQTSSLRLRLRWGSTRCSSL